MTSIPAAGRGCIVGESGCWCTVAGSGSGRRGVGGGEVVVQTGEGGGGRRVVGFSSSGGGG